MKKLSLLVVCLAFFGFANAQLANGSFAPNFHLFEINKTDGTIITTDTISLYNYTDAGKIVYMDIFATWCSPCFAYHSSHNLENLFTQYGPEGTNEVRVLGIEGSQGNYASLSGTGVDAGGHASQGDWLTGVGYPVIPTAMAPNTDAVCTDYAIAYFPTIYMVCPNRLVYEVGQQTTADLYASKSTCPSFNNTLNNNALIVNGSGINGTYYCTANPTPTITFQNVGNFDLTSASFTITLDGQTSTYDWTGTLAKYAVATVTLPQISVSTNGNHTYSVAVTTVNNVADADSVMNVYSNAFNVQVNGTTDPVSADFADNTLPANWSMANGLLDFYQGAAYFYAYGLSNGTTEELYLPLLNLNAFTTPSIHFDLAHARYNSSTTERLKIKYSSDCGSTWSTAYNVADPDLATANATTAQFIPSASQWRAESAPLTDLTNKDNVIVKFVFTSGYGNIVWIDNVSVVEGTGIEENTADNLTIYPNPATSVLNINSSASVQKVEVYNLQGQLVNVANGDVHDINVANLSNGTYIVRITTANGVKNQRFVKE